MQTKLTLRLDSELIEKAKTYAQATGRSVSQLVSDYFAVLESSSQHDARTTVPDLVASLHGCLTDSIHDEATYDSYRDRKYGGGTS